MERSFIIVSGIGPNSGGTGLMMRGLMAEAEGTSVRFVYRDKSRPRGWARLNPAWFLRQRWNRLFFGANARRAARSSGELLLLHPQSIRPAVLEAMVNSRARTWVYVLDSHFFCERSYNVLRDETSPCLRCLSGSDAPGAKEGCFSSGKAWPLRARFAEWVRSGKVRLLAQCASQARLLRRYYGEHIAVPVVPLMVPDLAPPPVIVRPVRHRPFVVFHGSPSAAKGIFVVRELARQLPDCDFLVPTARRKLDRQGGPVEGWPANVSFRRLFWDDGLAEAVAAADLVICPSVWSAPVEGAVLKSLSHNGLVGLIPDSTAFAGDIPFSARLDLDPADWEATSDRIRAMLADPARQASIRAEAARYIQDYRAANDGMLYRLYAAISSEGA